MNNYVCYHLHTEQSLIDSCTSHRLYADRAAELGQSAICYTEHGNTYRWIEKKQYAESKGLNYLHGVEVYLTEALEPKVRDNYHTILIAKNYEGFKELNSLMDLSTQEDHFYYKPRITFDEFRKISDNIIKISACLASPLNKIRKHNPLLQHYDYLEIQPHVNSEEQKEYNQYLYAVSLETGIPLIAGTDTHSVSGYKAECRSVLQKAKGIEFSDEDTYDLTYKSYDELVDMFARQGVLPEHVYLEAIENTNRMAESVENFELDLSFKYPKVEDEYDKLLERSLNSYNRLVSEGVIRDDSRYLENINEEMRVFDAVGMCGFMYIMSDIMTFCRESGIPTSPCRGSVGGSTVAYLTGITDVDPVLRKTVFSRFCNESRMEIGDIDVDISPDQRDMVYQYIIDRFGEDYCAYILTNGTVSDKGTIDEIGRALKIPLPDVQKIKDDYERDSEKARLKYPEVFYYFDGLLNTVISQSMHPAGIVASPINLVEHYGTFWSKGKRILSITMEEVHEVSLVKYDILGLKNIQILRNCCELIGIPYPAAHEVDWNDENVWDDIVTSPVGIFQMESPYAHDCLKKMHPRSVSDISLTNAAIRPSGESYRDRLFAGKINKNPSREIDELLKGSRGFLCYQEDCIKFLQDICGLSGSEADNVRRAIGRKQKDRLQQALPSILEGYCNKSKKPREVAEKEALDFLQIIEDSSNYQFGYNHSEGYSMLSYLCAYFRYHYPVEFVTSYLNNAFTDEDIAQGTMLASQKRISINPIKFGKSKAGYFMDSEARAIYKGVASIKFMNHQVADALYEMSKKKKYECFSDILLDIKAETGIDSRQIESLIRLDYFSDYGNSRELWCLYGVFDFLKDGDAKSISKSKLEVGSDLYKCVARHSKGVNDKGAELKSFKIQDCHAILRDMEKAILSKGMDDFPLLVKIDAQKAFLGHILATGKTEDRPMLYVMSVKPLKNKNTGDQFGYGVTTQSIGSGIQTRFTMLNADYRRSDGLTEGQVIKCTKYDRRRGYFYLKEFTVM